MNVKTFFKTNSKHNISKMPTLGFPNLHLRNDL